jgi:hypothetical protein
MWSCCSSLLSCLQGRQPLEGRVRPERVVLPAPAIGEELSLRCRCKQLGIDELIPPTTRKVVTPLNRKPGGLMEQSNASLQRGDQG